MSLSTDARTRLGIAVTDFTVGGQIADAIDGLTAAHNPITLGAVGSTPAAAGASLAVQVLTLQPADATHPGVVTTGAQTIAGDKSFTGIVTAANMAEGEATVLAGQSSIAVVDAGSSATSTVVATLAGADATALYVRYVARGAGTFTVHVGPTTATADLKLTWIRFN